MCIFSNLIRNVQGVFDQAKQKMRKLQLIAHFVNISRLTALNNVPEDF